MKLLTVSNTKTLKGESQGYLTGILMLQPGQLCPKASAGCLKACLSTAGRGRFDSIQEARAVKTQHFLHGRDAFIEQLADDIRALERQAKREGLTPCVRLNGTSDIKWEIVAPQLFEVFSHVQFYDYTKYMRHERRELPANYHLTFSYHEQLTEIERNMLRASLQNIAVVFETIPDTFLGKQVIDGTESDLRFLDPKNTIVGLLAKGKAKQDTSGFVVRS